MMQCKYPIDKKIKFSIEKIDSTSWAITDPVKCEIQFNENYFQSVDEITESINNDINANWNPNIRKGKELESIVAHEYGHIIYEQKIVGKMEGLFVFAIWNRFKKVPYQFVTDLSILATKNGKEMFAEAISQIEYGIVGKISNQIDMIVKEVFLCD